MRSFHTVTVKPTITASLQATGVFTTGDVIFDWTEVQVPKGTSRINGITFLIRGSNGVRQEFAMDLYFAKTITGVAPGSLGTLNATADGTGYQNHLIGAARMGVSEVVDGLDIMAVGAPQYLWTLSSSLTGDPDSGTNVGFDKLYIAGLSNTSSLPDFRSTVQVSTETATNTTAVVVKTTSALINFDKGDVLHDEDNQLIGTIKSVTDATNIVLEENCANVSAVNKDLYNINPITLILHLEK